MTDRAIDILLARMFNFEGRMQHDDARIITEAIGGADIDALAELARTRAVTRQQRNNARAFICSIKPVM